MSKYKFNDWSGPLENVEKFEDSLYELARKNYGVDQDGDCPVQIIVIDRTKYKPCHHFPVPYDHKIKSMEGFKEFEGAVFNNLDMALSAVQQANRCREFNLKKANKTK